MSRSEKMERGFVTIATGKERYYFIAYNLLCSYKINAGRYPFAIICDQENKYTAAFDKVVRIEHPSNSYLDKLRLYDCLPFDETIFIDADCLVYGDIDSWWDLFQDAGGCSVFGHAYEDLTTDKGWFLLEGTGEYRESIRFIPSFSSGVCYLRESTECAKVFNIAKDVAAHYNEYSFAIFKNPADEPVLALGLAVTGCRPVECDDVGLYSYKRLMRADIDIPHAEWYYNDEWKPIRLIHWGHFGTMKAYYLFEASKARRRLSEKPEKGFTWTVLYHYKLLYYALLTCDLVTLWKRIRNRIKNMLKDRKR